MTENLKRFLELLSKDPQLTAKASDAKGEELLAIAQELGVPLTMEDFGELSEPGQELSDDELDTVVGGGNCYCALGGGGKKDDQNKVCACVAYGQGHTRCGKVRCICPAAGGGASGAYQEERKCTGCGCDFCRYGL